MLHVLTDKVFGGSRGSLLSCAVPGMGLLGWLAGNKSNDALNEMTKKLDLLTVLANHITSSHCSKGYDPPFVRLAHGSPV